MIERHIRSHIVKMSGKRFDWGFKSLCGKKVEYAQVAPSKNLDGYCHKCIKSLIMKKESEIESLRSFLIDE